MAWSEEHKANRLISEAFNMRPIEQDAREYLNARYGAFGRAFEHPRYTQHKRVRVMGYDLKGKPWTYQVFISEYEWTTIDNNELIQRAINNGIQRALSVGVIVNEISIENN